MGETKLVGLTLGETATLCHLMMADEEFRRYLLTGKVRSARKGDFITASARLAIFREWEGLYAKLALANDVLMGKSANA